MFCFATKSLWSIKRKTNEFISADMQCTTKWMWFPFALKLTNHHKPFRIWSVWVHVITGQNVMVWMEFDDRHDGNCHWLNRTPMDSALHSNTNNSAIYSLECKMHHPIDSLPVVSVVWFAWISTRWMVYAATQKCSPQWRACGPLSSYTKWWLSFHASALFAHIDQAESNFIWLGWESSHFSVE